MFERLRMAWHVLRGRVDVDTHETPVSIEDGWGDGPIETAFVQWKGTTVCMDATCPACGANGHIDGDFAYFLTCDCGAIIQVGSYVPLRVLTEKHGEQYASAVDFVKYQGIAGRELRIRDDDES